MILLKSEFSFWGLEIMKSFSKSLVFYQCLFFIFVVLFGWSFVYMLRPSISSELIKLTLLKPHGEARVTSVVPFFCCLSSSCRWKLQPVILSGLQSCCSCFPPMLPRTGPLVNQNCWVTGLNPDLLILRIKSGHQGIRSFSVDNRSKWPYP